MVYEPLNLPNNNNRVNIDEMIELDIVDAYEIEIEDKDKDKILPQVEITILSEGFDYLPIFFDDFKIKYKRILGDKWV